MARPTFKLHWLVRRNPVTAEQVRAYADEHGLAVSAAKTQLAQAQAPVLQQWWEAEGWEHPDIVAAGGYWENIEVVVEPVPVAPRPTSEG